MTLASAPLIFRVRRAARVANHPMRSYPSIPLSLFAATLGLAATATFLPTSGCAEGSDTAAASSSSSGVTWSSSSSGGSGGNGSGAGGSSSSSASAAGGQAGNGGSSAGGSGGAGANGGAGGSGGGIASGDVVLLASGPSALFAGHRGQTTSWTTANLAGSSSDAPALSATTSGAVGAIRASADALRFTVFDGSSWSAAADVGASITTRAAPALAATGSASYLVYHGNDFMHYFGSYQTSWSPSAEPVAPSMAAQSFGPSAARITTLGSDALVAFAGSDGQLYTQARTTSWQAAVPLSTSKISASPSITALTSGADVLVAYINDDAGQPDDNKIFWATRSANVWSTPQKISDSIFSDEPVALASMSAGRALLAFRGSDGMAYVLTYDPAANPLWSAAGGIDTPNIAVASPPAVAPGGVGALAELAYVETAGGAVGHVRLTTSGWTTPTTVGGSNLTHVAIATAP